MVVDFDFVGLSCYFCAAQRRDTNRILTNDGHHANILPEYGQVLAHVTASKDS